MESMEGITAHKAATLGYLEHKTQQGLSFQVRCYGPFDSRKYGLYSSNVGADVKKNDFFENVVPRTVRCDVPQEAVYTGMTEVYKQSGIYSYTHSFSGELCYARYCQFEGNKDWYACDYTGGLGTQPQKLSYFIDADAGNISQYNGISVSSKWDKVFTYNNGEEIMLRYGSLNGSDNGWYPASGESFDVACDAQPIIIDNAEISQDTKESKDKYDFAKISPLEISILSAMGIVLISLIIMVASLYRRSKR